MNRPFAGAMLILATAFASPAARADDDADPWLGEDKVKHYGVSAGIAAGGYVVGAIATEPRAYALATGAGFAVLAGVGKELADLAGAGQPSWKDLAWDGLGMVSGLALAWGVDLLVRGVSTRHPAFAIDRGGIAF